MYLILFLRETNDTLDVSSTRKKVERIDLGHFISFIDEDLRVPRQRIGVAGDVDDLGDARIMGEGIKELTGAACARGSRITAT